MSAYHDFIAMLDRSTTVMPPGYSIGAWVPDLDATAFLPQADADMKRAYRDVLTLPDLASIPADGTTPATTHSALEVTHDSGVRAVAFVTVAAAILAVSGTSNGTQDTWLAGQVSTLLATCQARVG